MLLEESLKMLRILKAQNIGNLLGTEKRVKNGIFGHFYYLCLNIFLCAPSRDSLYQIAEIVRRKTYLVGKILHSGQTVDTGIARIPILVEQPFKTGENIVV